MSEEIDYDHHIFDARQQEADKNLAVRFYTQPMKNEARTLEEGRAIFEDTEFIEIRVRGDRNNIVIRPCREDDKQRFRGAYQAWVKHQATGEHDGTPLSEWPAVGPSMVEELRYLGFYTVEQLATASDTHVAKVPGLQTFKQKAQLFIEFAKGIAPIDKLQSKLDETNSQLQMAQQTAADMTAKFAELEKKYAALADKIATAAPTAKSK